MDEGPLLYPPHLRSPVTMVGCGGIGSNLWPVLARLGVLYWKLYDDDLVNPVNLAAQNFREADIGLHKCDVLARDIQQVNSRAQVKTCPRRFDGTESLDGVVISAVDSMVGRKMIFEAVMRARNRVVLYIDGRLSRRYHNFFDLYVIDPTSDWEMGAYKKSLFDDAELPYAPRPEKPAAHTPVLLAGFTGAVLARWIETERRPWRVAFDTGTWNGEPYFAPA